MCVEWGAGVRLVCLTQLVDAVSDELCCRCWHVRTSQVIGDVYGLAVDYTYFIELWGCVAQRLNDKKDFVGHQVSTKCVKTIFMAALLRIRPYSDEDVLNVVMGIVLLKSSASSVSEHWYISLFEFKKSHWLANFLDSIVMALGGRGLETRPTSGLLRSMQMNMD